MIFLILLILILILQYHSMHRVFNILNQLITYKFCFHHLINHLIIHPYYFLLLLLIFLFRFFFFANILNSLSFSIELYSYGFSKKLHFSLKVLKSTSNFSNISFISSSNIFNFLFVSFFISFISCSLSNFSFFFLV